MILNVAFYLTGHGFGHTTRMTALMEELIKAGVKCYVVTDRPKHLFANLNPQYYLLREGAVDFGIDQKNWHSPDKTATIRKLKELWTKRAELIKLEQEFLQREEIKLIISDIPFIPFAAAKELNIPAIGISNFDWYFIYSEMFKAENDQELKDILEAIKQDYATAKAGFRLPFSSQESMQSFQPLFKTGILARTTKAKSSVTRERFRISSKQKIILLVYVGEPEEDLKVLEQLCELRGYTVLGKNSNFKHSNYRFVPSSYPFLELITAAEIVVTKTGYSTIAETVQSNKKLICFDRNGFPEDRVLKAGLESYPQALFIPNNTLPEIDWRSLIKEVEQLKPQTLPPLYKNCNNNIARKILHCFFQTNNDSNPKRFSIIDVGTNNILMLWAEEKEGKTEIVHRASRISAMGKNIKANLLTKAGIERAKVILRDFVGFSQSYTENIIVTGTSCSRESKNIDLLSGWLQKKYRIEYRILSGEQEAFYTGLANRALFKEKPELIIFDIGGGSTEFIYYRNRELLYHTSLKLGVRRLESLCGKNKQQMKAEIKQALTALPETLLKNPALVGVGGTVTNISAVKQKLYRYDGRAVHGSILTRKDIDYYYELFSKLKTGEIAELMPFEPLRADVITIGVLIVQQIMQHFSLNQITTSDFGLQFGVLTKELA